MTKPSLVQYELNQNCRREKRNEFSSILRMWVRFPCILPWFWIWQSGKCVPKAWEIILQASTKAGIFSHKEGGYPDIMTCRDLCTRIRRTRPGNGKGRYASGQKFCFACDLFLVCEKLRCPCCNSVLRVKPRQRKDKDTFRKYLEVTLWWRFFFSREWNWSHLRYIIIQKT